MSIFYEMDKNFGDLLDEKKNFLFIGEAGSGKSEIVLNVAGREDRQQGSGVRHGSEQAPIPLQRYEGCIRP